MTSETFVFGPFVLDPRERVLRRDQVLVPLKPKDVDVLLALVERHGALVDKSALFELVWRGVTVEECNLSQHVAALRRALGDDARVPAFIETVPRRGYRFVAAVERTSATAPTPPPLPAPTPVPAPAATLDPAPPDEEAAPPSPAPRARVVWPLRLAFAAVGLGVALLAVAHLRPTSTRPAMRSLAVLPVEDLTGERRHARLAEALTEALIADLQGSGGAVDVEPGQAPGAEVPVERAAPFHAAEVDAVVECSIVGDGERLKVIAELLDARHDRLLWADVFESDPVAYPELEERMARALVERIRRAAEGLDRGPPPTPLQSARREYELARFFMGPRTPQVVRESLEHFEAAAALAPEWAPARAGLAEALLLAAEHRVVPPGFALSRAEGEARRALALEPRLAEALATLGGVAAARWDFQAAERAYRLALELDPALAVAHARYAALLTLLDRHPEAITQARAALDLEPTSPAAAVALAAAYLQAGDLDRALVQARSVLRSAPRLAAAYEVLGRAEQAAGHPDQAATAFAEAVRVSGRNPVHVAALARLQARRGVPEARALLDELRPAGAGPAGSPLDVAAVLAALGETDRAFETLERAVDEGVPWLPPSDPGQALAGLHDDPRFAPLVERMRAGTGDARARAVDTRGTLAVPVRAMR